jgi:hypothetical protein
MIQTRAPGAHPVQISPKEKTMPITTLRRRTSLLPAVLSIVLITLSLSSTAAQTASPAKIEVMTVHQFSRIYQDTRSGADDDLSIWRLEEIPAGYHPLGDVAMGSYSEPQTAIVVKEKVPGTLAAPTGWTRVWNDRDSGGKYHVNLWKPTPPPGYVCLGDVATPSGEPALDQIRCIRADYVVAGSAQWVWDDSGSGVHANAGVWQASNRGTANALRPNTFLSQASHSPGSQQFPLLKMDLIDGMESTARPDWERIAHAFAPDVYQHGAEEFMPSDVEYHLAHTTIEDAFMVAELSCAICTDPPFLRGKNPEESAVPMYAVIHPKNGPARKTDGIAPGDAVVDIVYWLFYPYQRGKSIGPILGDETTFGNHVGDWEHMTFRFVNARPYRVFLSAHAGGETYEFGDQNLEMHWAPSGRFRTVAYSALGTHALYARSGRHVYKKIKKLGVTLLELVDETHRGARWQGAESLEVLRWERQGSYTGEYDWMNLTARWGNSEQACISELDVCQLEDGPTGPASKKSMDPNFFDLD